MNAPLDITNKQARALWLSAQGLATAPVGKLDALKIIKDLGFVQLDTIQVVSRAHHHIIWSRNQNYREPVLDRLLGKERAIFEHFTHDASVIPMAYLPYWKRQFERKRAEIERSGWWKKRLDDTACDAIKARISQEGPLSTHAFDSEIVGDKAMWSRPPHKMALDYLWYAGELATCHRVNFTKFYDLSERIFPECDTVPEHEQVNWLCQEAMARLGFATTGEVKRFWDAITTPEAKAWYENQPLIPVRVRANDGTWFDASAPAEIEDRLAALDAPTSRLRILNPFDPVIRDRDRLLRLFGFYYRVEMFVPAAKRQWGYYVYPILEGDRFVGRIEAKGDRAKGILNVLNLWHEDGVKWTAARAEKLHAELGRMARFIGVSDVQWHCSETPTKPIQV